MILPPLRNSFGRTDAARGLTPIAPDAKAREREEERMREEGIDALFDDPRTLNAILTTRGIANTPPTLVFYLLARHALLEDGINNPIIADYLAALLLEFGKIARAHV